MTRHATLRSLGLLALLLGPSCSHRVVPVTAAGAPGKLTLSTQRDGSGELPRDLPGLLHAAMPHARAWQPDAVPLTIQIEHIDESAHLEVKMYFASPAAGTVQIIEVTPEGVTTNEFRRSSRGAQPLPTTFVDLPAAVRAARAAGMTEPLSKAGLSFWRPSGAPPVVAWLLISVTEKRAAVNAATGEAVDVDLLTVGPLRVARELKCHDSRE